MESKHTKILFTYWSSRYNYCCISLKRKMGHTLRWNIQNCLKSKLTKFAYSYFYPFSIIERTIVLIQNKLFLNYYSCICILAC